MTTEYLSGQILKSYDLLLKTGSTEHEQDLSYLIRLASLSD